MANYSRIVKNIMDLRTLSSFIDAINSLHHRPLILRKLELVQLLSPLSPVGQCLVE